MAATKKTKKTTKKTSAEKPVKEVKQKVIAPEEEVKPEEIAEEVKHEEVKKAPSKAESVDKKISKPHSLARFLF